MCVAAVLEPDVGPEHHRRSSSMRVTGSSYCSIVRQRSSDDCIIGTHLGMGTLNEGLTKVTPTQSPPTSNPSPISLNNTRLYDNVQPGVKYFIHGFSCSSLLLLSPLPGAKLFAFCPPHALPLCFILSPLNWRWMEGGGLCPCVTVHALLCFRNSCR